MEEPIITYQRELTKLFFDKQDPPISIHDLHAVLYMLECLCSLKEGPTTRLFVSSSKRIKFLVERATEALQILNSKNFKLGNGQMRGYPYRRFMWPSPSPSEIGSNKCVINFSYFRKFFQKSPLRELGFINLFSQTPGGVIHYKYEYNIIKEQCTVEVLDKLPEFVIWDFREIPISLISDEIFPPLCGDELKE